MGLLILMMSMFPSIAKGSDKITQLLDAYPKELLSAFDMDKLDFGDVFGYYSVEGYLFITLFGSIYTILLASGILSKEQGDKTIEFLLSKPITRKEIVTSKLLTFLTNIVILNLLLTLSLLFSATVLTLIQQKKLSIYKYRKFLNNINSFLYSYIFFMINKIA